MSQPLESKFSKINANEPEEMIPIELASIPVLPNECLVSIFDHVKNMEDLETIRRVCVRWRELVERKLKSIKNAICYRQGMSLPFLPLPYGIARRTVYIKVEYSEERNKETYRCIPSHLLPNLEIIDFCYTLTIVNTYEDLTTNEKVVARFLEPIIARNPEKIIGLGVPYGAEKLVRHFNSLSIFSMDNVGQPSESDLRLVNKSKLKQLYCNALLEWIACKKEFKNLESLKTYIDDINSYCRFQRRRGTLFTKLETLIIDGIHVKQKNREMFLFNLVDISLELKNVYLRVDWDTFARLRFSKRNLSVQTLVLNVAIYPRYSRLNHFDRDNRIWSKLIKFLKFHPNLKHLAIKHQPYDLERLSDILSVSETKLLQLLKSLPNLVLLKLEDENPAFVSKVIDEFNSQAGRSIKFTKNICMDSVCTEFTTGKNNDFIRKYFSLPDYKVVNHFMPIIA